KDLLHAGQLDLAVVMAQVAFETLVRDAVSDELDALSDQLDDLGLGWLRPRIKSRSYSLIDDRVRRFWDDLMGDEIGNAEAWGNYKAHVLRRNGVVHEGGSVEHVQAKESVEAVEAMIGYVEQVRRGRGAS